MSEVNYKYHREFESEEVAKKVADYFHSVLKGNPDYRETRILLNVNGCEVLLAEFHDSNTHIHVDDSGSFPILELFIAV
ncbi:MAG: hypothetical protein IKG04_07815 [Exiguobacterium sp.]|nr:hypothetical protein [Exiguobacterium sp.]